MTQLMWTHIPWAFLLIGYIFQSRAYTASRKECAFLYKMLRMHTNTTVEIIQQREKLNDPKV